ncbi:MAG: hypothetical protein ACRDTA_01210 [Pseudonocardiaceae bacterium]
MRLLVVAADGQQRDDTESGVALQRALTGLDGERTLLVIAHRPMTIRAASRIAVLRDGRVMEQGRYDDLLAAGGPFTELVRHGPPRDE